MTSNRMEAFSDGVLAIIITIMVLELRAPHSADWHAILPILPIFLGYALSFIYVGIYWNNHHHLLAAVEKVDGKVMWANLHLLFWLSLIPFTTGWMGDAGVGRWTVAAYGFVLLMSAGAFTLLTTALRKLAGEDSTLAKAVGEGKKGQLSLVLYLAAIALAFVEPWLSVAIFITVAALWFLPAPNVEREVEKQKKRSD